MDNTSFAILLNRFIKEVGFVKYQIESYNDFVTRRIPAILKEIKVIKPDVPDLGDLKIKLGEFRIGEPSVRESDGSIRKILPMEARIRSLTYSAPMYVEMKSILNGVESNPVFVHFGDLPVMVKSKVCPLSRMDRLELIRAGEDPDDPGGYFIVNGTERLLVLIEDIASNKIIVSNVDSGSIKQIARIHSEKFGYVQRHLLERKDDGTIYISFANVTRLPIVTLIKALGLVKDNEIIAAISDDPEVQEEFYVNLLESEIETQEDAMDAIGKHIRVPQKSQRLQKAKRIIDKYLLPHIGQNPSDRLNKAIFLCKAIERIIKVHLGKSEEDDLDHYSNKRIRLSGDLLDVLLRSILLGKSGLVARINYKYQQLTKRGKMPPLAAIVEANVVTNQINSALAIGTWVGKKTGVSQKLHRDSFLRTLSHLRVVVSPLTSTQEHFEARELHPTHFGKLCTSETPEGATIGLRKYLALMAEITKGINEKEREKVRKMIKLGNEGADVFFDGEYLGKTDEPEELVKKIREARRKGEISYQVNVAYFPGKNEVRINGDSGRVRRPLIIIENGTAKLTKEIIEQVKENKLGWFDLIKKGIIEYLDAEEEENAYIAMKEEEITKEHTHLELHPATILGLSANLLCFPEYNRGDRVNYGAKMGGQAIGIFSTNFKKRVDAKFNILMYPQAPLVQTFLHKLAGFDKRSGGQNVVIAFNVYDGYNMEDALVFNKHSIQRGLFWSYMFRTYEAEEKKYLGGQEDIITIPDPNVRGYAGEDAYKHLPEDGIINPETRVSSDQVLVGRISPLRFLGSMDQFITGIENIRETSIRLRHGDKGIVDKVIITETSEGSKLVKVVVRDLKIPEVGDKFATRHGQKGVIGLIANQEDLPFNEEGVVPDVVFDAHGIPSRMTVGQLLETIAAKLAAKKGEIILAPPFSGPKEEYLRQELKNFGYRDDGMEAMYEGRFGTKFKRLILLGSIYYQKLDHLVSNKIHARARGPVALLTKQPTEGRSKEGGLRLGEMEKDCLIAHGAVLTLKERFESDKTRVLICPYCGMFAINDIIRKVKYCPIHGEVDAKEVEMSYAFKLLIDELRSMCIYPKIIVKEDMPKIERIEFSVLSPEMIKKMAVARITKTELYDSEGYPIEGGLLDPRLGVVDPGIRCRTCGAKAGVCPGHFGYLELTKPVIHVLYAKFIFALLKIFCQSCGRILVPDDKIDEFRERRITFQDLAKATKKQCPHCGYEQKKVKFVKPHNFYFGDKYVNPEQVRELLEKIPDADLDLLGLKIRPEWLVLTILPIAPVTVRPSITLETGERSEDDLTHKLVEIVRINERLAENIELGAPQFIIEDLWELLQYHISTYFDNEISGVPPARHRSGKVLKTLAQRLKTKEGRFRRNLIGKRVNFSARTVISPDPWIDIDEVGVPEIVAKELTVPITVTDRNLKEMREIVLKGPDAIDGANYIITPTGLRKKITNENKEMLAKELAPGYIVERHLRDGDIVIFNRQPSLHRMSMMAHRVRVIPFKTFTINLTTIIPYNADFDGDEMNLHVPQNEEARVEAMRLMNVVQHIRSPRFSGPIVGCVRDHLTGLYLLTRDDTVLSREEVVELVRNVDKNISIPNKKTFTGKEVFSLFLPKDLNLEFKSKVGTKVVIKNGKLVEGVIDKAGVGAESGKIIDFVEKYYGKQKAAELIRNFAYLSLLYLRKVGFSISLSDYDLSESARKKIQKIIADVKKDVNELIEKYKQGKLEVLTGRTPKETLESLIKRRINKAISDVEVEVVKEVKEDNNALILAKSGARGSMINFVQVAALIGQEMIMGERIERGYYGRTFPHFRKGDISLEAKGFVGKGFKQGLNPFEFFFDAMNSRESLMDKSLKTRHSGYMERRLVGALEDLKVEYDGTVRDSDGKIIQFISGGDGLDPSKIMKGGINVEEIARRLFS